MPRGEAVPAGNGSLSLSVVTPMPGERVVVSGHSDRGGGLVTLQSDRGPRGSWKDLVEVRADADGQFTVAWGAPSDVRTLRLRALVDGRQVAPTRTVRVRRPQVRISAPTDARAGDVLAVTVHSVPARPGRRIEVQRRVVGARGWEQVATGTEDAAGRAVVALPTPSTPTLLELRAFAHAPRASSTSASRTVLLDGGAHVESRVVRPRVEPAAAPRPGAPAVGGLLGQDGDWGPIAEQRMRWDACRALPYRVNLSSVPRRLQNRVGVLVHSAVRTLARDSGLVLLPVGTTTWRDPERGSSADTRGRPADAGMTIEVRHDPASSDYSGYADVRSMGTGIDGSSELVSADVVVQTPGAGRGALDEAMVRNLLLHELGHAVGLGHVSQKDQVMRHFITGEPLLEFQRGDRAGLLALGSPAGCWEPAAP